jgi:hypothetical protein
MSDNSIRRMIELLSDEERKVLEYFVRYRSVGDLLAVRELKGLYKVREPTKIINRLIELGLLDRGIGCYNISKDVLKLYSESNVVRNRWLR